MRPTRDGTAHAVPPSRTRRRPGHPTPSPRTMLRKSLDWLYLGSAWLAALCMVGVLSMVLLSIVSRLMSFYVPGTDAYAGYAMAGAGFLALAHTLKHGEHIRVTLIISRFAGKAR
ncbi:TRAP transporter small permease subunit, partial [Arthrospira platensis SPKY1]|nr:TRAP transporter small permease subunit [Arthrospira platensis SPKY1]